MDFFLTALNFPRIFYLRNQIMDTLEMETHEIIFIINYFKESARIYLLLSIELKSGFNANYLPFAVLLIKTKTTTTTNEW